MAAAVLAGAIGGGDASARPATYRFDTDHSQVLFSVSHEDFSRPVGRLRIAGGWFTFDPDDWSASRVDISIDLATVDLGDPKWNDAVESPQFLDANHWRTARYTGGKVERSGDKTGIIHGTLDFHGHVAPVDVSFTLNRIGNDPYAFAAKAGFSARAKISRSAFGLTRFRDVVGDEVDLRFEIEGLRGGEPEGTR